MGLPRIQGYLTKKPPPPRTLQYLHAEGPAVVLRGWVVFLWARCPCSWWQLCARDHSQMLDLRTRSFSRSCSLARERFFPVRGDQIVQGYLAHKNQRPPRTLHWDYAWGPTVVLGGGAVSYERGTPVSSMPFINTQETVILWGSNKHKTAFGFTTVQGSIAD